MFLKSDLINYNKRNILIIIVYVSLLLDNMLLTVIVPILPDILTKLDNESYVSNVPSTLLYKTFEFHYVPGILGSSNKIKENLENINLTTMRHNENGSLMNNDFKQRKAFAQLEDENGAVGILLAIKALVQMVANPIVGTLSSRFGYNIPIVFGTLNMLFASLIFALSNSYLSILVGRAVQGIGSSCVGVCGMSLVAQLYPEDDKRSKIMGIVLGSVALGVLIGYPFGGISYAFIGQSSPFWIIFIFLLINLVFQFSYMELSRNIEICVEDKPKWTSLLSDQLILTIVFAICISTSAMSVLEPCLPIWMISNLNPKKWQLGTVFIPDSIGYLLGTNFFGTIAYKYGQLKVSTISMFLIGISCIILPTATSVRSLLLPHFGLGLGIGALDAALVPFLASLVDSKYNSDIDDSPSSGTFSHYGAVYAIQQMSVSFAYAFAPMIGGELVQIIGFSWLMTIIGIINCLYGPFLILSFVQYYKYFDKTATISENIEMNHGYKRMYKTIE